MYNYYDSSIQYKKILQPRGVNQEIFESQARLVVTRSGKLGTTLKSRLNQGFLSHKVVTRSRMKTGNLAFFESVTRQLL